MRNLKIILQILFIIGCIAILAYEYHPYKPKKKERNPITEQLRYYQMKDAEAAQKPQEDKRYIQAN